MKSYGFKFHNRDSSLTGAIDIRFWSVFFGVLCGVLNAVSTGEKGDMGVFMPFTFVYIVLSLGAEFFRKTFFALIILFSIVTISGLFYLVAYNYSECIRFCPDPEFRSRGKPEYLTLEKSIFIIFLGVLYTSPMLFISLRALKKSDKKNSDIW